MAVVRIRRSNKAAPLRPAGEASGIEIVAMRRRHVRAVSAIENRIFPRPWSPALYYSELTMPSTRLYYVALLSGEVVGYVGCMLIVGEGHITTIGVAPEYQRRKIGLMLLHRVTLDAIARGATSMTLEVRVANLGAQALYRSFGYAPAGIRKNYYAEVNEDGLVMWAQDVDSPDYAARLERLAASLDSGQAGSKDEASEGAQAGKDEQ